ncbi:MAG: hypothetical protein HKL99_14190 [Burkholderiales bacterium]|nr:hypothetical protein [Burkholderiales bacterium]
MKVLLPANPEQPGFVMPMLHPTHGPCMVHVGGGTDVEVAAAMRRCGIVVTNGCGPSAGIEIKVVSQCDGLAYRVGKAARARRRLECQQGA